MAEKPDRELEELAGSLVLDPMDAFADASDQQQRQRPAIGDRDPVDGDGPAVRRGGDDDPSEADGEDGDEGAGTGGARGRNHQKRVIKRMSLENRRFQEELRSSNERVDRLERLLLKQDADRTTGSLRDELNAAESEFVKAHDDGATGAEMLALQKKRDKVRDRLNRAEHGARRLELDGEAGDPSPARTETREPQQRAGPPSDLPRAGRDWMRRQRWFDWECKDPDSHTASLISKKLIEEEGYALDEPELYQEIDKRMAQIRPNLYERTSRGESRRDDPDGDYQDGDLPRTAGNGQRANIDSGGGRRSRVPPPSEAEKRLAEKVGELDLSDKKTYDLWIKNREETMTRRRR